MSGCEYAKVDDILSLRNSQPSGFGRSSERRAWQPTPVFLPRESPWTEEHSRLQSMGSQRAGRDWVTKQSTQHSLVEETDNTGCAVVLWTKCHRNRVVHMYSLWRVRESLRGGSIWLDVDWFVHSFSRYVLCPYYVLGTVLDPEDTKMNKKSSLYSRGSTW